MTLGELRAALELTWRIERLKLRLDDIRQCGGVSGAMGERVVGGGGLFVGQALAEQDEIITELCRQLADERVIIRRYLDKSSLGATEKNIMIRRYVDCLPWGTVAALSGYTERQAHNYHQQALKDLKL